LNALHTELKEIRKKLTGKGNLLFPDIWNSAVSSGQVRLLNSEQVTKLAKVYRAIKGQEYEAKRLRDVAEDYRKSKSGYGYLQIENGSYERWTDYSFECIMREEELQGMIDTLLKEKWWT